MKNKKYLAIIIFFTMLCLPSAPQADELSFETTQYYGTGAWPCGITVGDLNNDGYHDIVTANWTSNNVSVLLSNGDGTFQAAVNYGAGSGPYAPAIGDLNGDGNSDIAVVNEASGNVSVLIGNGDGTFDPAVNYAVGTYPTWVSIGYINTDSYLDMVTANSDSNTISVLLGNGDGTFSIPATNYDVLGEPLEVEIYDLDNDGDQDVAVACYSGNNMAVLLNDGSGALGSAVYYTAGYGTRAAAVGDLNRDGAPDIVTGNYINGNNYVSVLLGNGDGTFQGPSNYTSGNDNTRSVVLIDFNNDGFHDIAVTNYNEGTLSVLLGNGDGTFQTAVEYAADVEPHGIAVGDFNKDGRPDIATNNGGADNVAVLINNSVTGSNDGEAFITTTQEYYTSGFPSPATFYFQTGNNVFEEADGTLHAAYIENYELYYLQSTDGGANWTKENIASTHNGDVYSAALTVDHDGNVFIGFTAHDLFNYDNPPANNYGSEWYYDLYSVNNTSGSWVEDSLYTHVSNYGAKAMAMVVDGDNNIHLFANRYGWSTTGGTAWEWVRNSASGTWGGQMTAATVTDASVDHFFYDYYRPMVDSTGTITLIMSRANSTSGDDDRLFYVQNDGTWSGITAIDQPNRDYASTYHFDAAIDGSDHIYLVYLKDLVPGVPQILFSTDFGTATPIYTGQAGERIYDLKLHSDADGNLTLFIRRGLTTVQGSSIGFLYPTSMATRPSGGSWSTLKSLPSSAPDGDIFYLSVAHTDTFSDVFNAAKLTYFDREITGQTGPYGPDNLYFNDLYLNQAQRVWTQVNADGFGDVNNTGVQNMIVYNNRLYMNTSNPTTGCEVWAYDGSNWIQVNTDGFGDANNWHAIGMTVYNNRLYVGTFNNTTGAEVWEYDGANWVQFNTDGFGNSSTRSVYALIEYNGNLYAGTYALGGGEVWEYFNAAWTQVNSDGFGDSTNTAVERMVVYNDNLYVGTDQAEVWAYNGSNWVRMNTDGFGDTYNWDIYGLVVYNDRLYAGTYNPTTYDGTGGEVWAYDGAAWTQVNADGFGDANNENAFPSVVFYSRLYAGTGNQTTGGEMWEYDGSQWTQVATGGFDDVGNQNVWHMAEYNGDLYAGTFNGSTGAEVWGFLFGTQVQYTLTVSTAGQGNVTLSPSGGTYDAETVVTLTANADSGWVFAGWSGDLSGTTNPTTITMDSYKTVTVTFTQVVVNNPPSAPTGLSPEEEEIVTSDSVVLTASAFTDPDSGDSQVASYWMIRRADSVYGRLDYDESFDFEAVEGDMTSHEVTGLSSGMKYVWKVGYVDSGSGEVTWSDEYSFKVGESISEAMPEIEEGADIVNYKMMSFPYWLDDPSALTVFDIEYDTRYYRIGHYEADRNNGEYVEVDAPGAEINPGEAIWVLAREGIDVFADGIPVSDAYDIEVPLRYNETNGNGWNQIGCPNAKEYMWGDIEVIEYSEGGEVLFGPTPISELEQANEYIDIRIWEWVGGEYDSYTPDDEFILIPYEGYWVRARKANVHLNFPMSVQLTESRVGRNVFAAYFDKGKRWLKDWIVATPMAVADSGDSPPMPMGAFTDSNESRASQGGCFIVTAAHGSRCPVMLSGLFVLLLGVTGLVLFHRQKK